MPLLPAVPRGLALAWFVFPSAAAFWTYGAVLLAAWVYSVSSICVLRRVKDLPKPVLARDVAFIVLCYVSPCAVGAASELLSSGAHLPSPNHDEACDIVLFPR